jgi:tetratricopeptide (TPR) repeat protein
MRLRILLVFSAAPIALTYAQDADTAIFESHTKFTLLSQIENPNERNAFSAAYNAKTPAARHSLAESFIQLYPQSWLLAQAYDIAARSSVDLDQYDRALSEARFSLRLLPENPTLLVLVANMEAQKQLFVRAERDAQDALEYLDEFSSPGNRSGSQWSKGLPELKASAYFALGRAYTVKGLANDVPQANSLKQAMHALDCASAWNPEDTEISYLRGIVSVKLGEWPKAVSDLVFAAQHSDQLRAKSLNALRLIYQKSRSPGLSFDDFLTAQRHRQIDKALRGNPGELQPSPAILDGYAGPKPCEECHPAEYANWRQTGMARMFRAYSPGNVIGDFLSG